ncbi:MAG: dienelactone hydrolase family protein [Bacteroidetes bacterium]|nr:dienelactone hydrolase family protein [Bacteroidota bacterium]
MLEYIDHIESAASPTLVLLHGYGSNKEDLFGLLPYFKGYNLVCFQAPIAMGMGSFAWYPIDWNNGAKIINSEEVASAKSLVLDAIDDWTASNQITGRMVIGGFSQGAILSTAVYASGYKAAGYVFLSGYALPEWHNELSSLVSNIPVFQSHGTEDPVLPFEWAQATSELLTTNSNYNFHAFTMGHSLNMPCISKLQEFLKKTLS